MNKALLFKTDGTAFVFSYDEDTYEGFIANLQVALNKTVKHEESFVGVGNLLVYIDHIDRIQPFEEDSVVFDNENDEESEYEMDLNLIHKMTFVEKLMSKIGYYKY